ncbi:hypothetical protein AIIKEEIJ_05318 [Rhodococcus sp. YH1]|nr:hypothetical protein [Rhodococcus sp. YH1]
MPRTKANGIDTMPGLASGKRAKSAFGNIEDGLPDTAGEKAMSSRQLTRPP